jgi:hypothetical protein
LLGGDDLQNVVTADRSARGHEPSQCVVNQVETFLLGGMQDLQILPDGGGFGRAVQQLVVGHSEPRGGVHVVGVFVVNKGTRLADQ